MAFDWITPAKSLIERAAGKKDTIVVHESHFAHVLTTLKAAGIKISNPSLVGDKFAFDVDADKAELARRLLGG